MTDVVEVAGGTVTVGGTASTVAGPAAATQVDVDGPDGATTITVDSGGEGVTVGAGATVVAAGPTQIQIIETGSSGGGGLGDVGKGFRLSTLNSGSPFGLQSSAGQPSQGICGLPTIDYDDFGGSSTISVDDANSQIGGGPQTVMTPVEWGGNGENGWVWKAPVAGRWHHDLSILIDSNAADDLVYAMLVRDSGDQICGAAGWSHTSATLGLTWAQASSSANFDVAAGEIVWLQLLTISPDGIAPVRISDNDAATGWSGYLIST